MTDALDTVAMERHAGRLSNDPSDLIYQITERMRSKVGISNHPSLATPDTGAASGDSIDYDAALTALEATGDVEGKVSLTDTWSALGWVASLPLHRKLLETLALPVSGGTHARKYLMELDEAAIRQKLIQGDVVNQLSALLSQGAMELREAFLLEQAEEQRLQGPPAVQSQLTREGTSKSSIKLVQVRHDGVHALQCRRFLRCRRRRLRYHDHHNHQHSHNHNQKTTITTTTTKPLPPPLPRTPMRVAYISQGVFLSASKFSDSSNTLTYGPLSLFFSGLEGVSE